MNIKPSDISVVVQGNIEPCTIKLLKSVRRFLPGAELIVSTWKSAKHDGLDCDKLVLNTDPGAVVFDKEFYKNNNINRIIVSCRAGTRVATRKYILLMRSDLLLVNNNVLKFTDHFKRNPKASLFKQRIFVYELFSMKFEEKNQKYYSIFHISDWCRFGLTNDIRKLYDIKTVSEPEFSQYFIKHYHDKVIDLWDTRMWKMSPEQYITSQSAKKVFPKLDIKHRLDWREEILRCSDEFIVNNFIVKSIKDWGIVTQKPMYKNTTSKNYSIVASGAWLDKNWLLDYKKYIDNDFIIPLKYVYLDYFGIRESIVHLKRHLNEFLYPIRMFLKWFDNIFGCCWYFGKICVRTIYLLPKVIYMRIKKRR